ncbi:MAG: hypothetical protein ABI461_22155 [Polyangiaceae bacterium]
MFFADQASLDAAAWVGVFVIDDAGCKVEAFAKRCLIEDAREVDPLATFF